MSGLLPLLSWTTIRLLRSPATWLAVLGLWLWWAVGTVLGPIGLTLGSRTATELFYEIAFVSSLAGAALAAGPRGQARALLARETLLRRGALELALLAWGAGLLTLAGTLPAWILAHGPHLEALPLLGGAALGVLHLAVLARLVAALKPPAPLEPVLLLVLAWVLPAAVAGSDLGARILDGIFDVARSWRAPSPVDGLRTGAAIAVLYLTEGLLSGHPSPRLVRAR